MPHKAKPDHYLDLKNVTTLADACRRWGRSKSTITYAIDTGNVAALRVGRSVLISTRSLVAWFGSPKRV